MSLASKVLTLYQKNHQPPTYVTKYPAWEQRILKLNFKLKLELKPAPLIKLSLYIIVIKTNLRSWTSRVSSQLIVLILRNSEIFLTLSLSINLVRISLSSNLHVTVWEGIYSAIKSSYKQIGATYYILSLWPFSRNV